MKSAINDNFEYRYISLPEIYLTELGKTSFCLVKKVPNFFA